MEPHGISVTEIRLGLPDTHYYLQWEAAAAPPRPSGRRAVMAAARGAGRSLGWTIVAAGGDAATARLVFRTAADNLEYGLDALLRDARAYRIYLIEPVAALPRVARHVQGCAVNAPTRRPNSASPIGESKGLPEIHYGLFMGEQAWAEHMLDLLIRCSRAEPAGARGALSLSELAATHANRSAAITDAYRSGSFSLGEIAEHFDMHFSEVSAILNTASQS